MREWLWLDDSTIVTDQLSVLVFGRGATPFPSANCGEIVADTQLITCE